ncbi:unnamed protein product [Cercopithifilaria johnstoni]|uniref:Uncharacterized protein n=1 Tax=Cercopithifilaria johnstoni TaxID=2874296 RepID=A0A8J2LZT7_9BILA|nr:unnamed protein product [Cercopithifilaria johnstoni]
MGFQKHLNPNLPDPSIQPSLLHSVVPSSVAPPINVAVPVVSCWSSSLSLFRNLLVVSGAGPNVTYRYVHFCITDNDFIPIRSIRGVPVVLTGIIILRTYELSSPISSREYQGSLTSAGLNFMPA